MSETINNQRVFNELKSLREDVTFIKKHMFDPDTVMTSEEAKRFEESLKELKSNKTTSLSDMKKEVGL